jgi:hypothetical protein
MEIHVDNDASAAQAAAQAVGEKLVGAINEGLQYCVRRSKEPIESFCIQTGSAYDDEWELVVLAHGRETEKEKLKRLAVEQRDKERLVAEAAKKEAYDRKLYERLKKKFGD